MTILGKHTLAEVKDLVADYDYKIIQTTKLYQQFAPNWTNTDERKEWEAEWSLFNQKYSKVRTTAKEKIAAALAANAAVGPSVIPAEDLWQQIRDVVADGRAWTTGDYPDLRDRLQNASGKAIDLTGRPTYDATDIDFSAYNVSNTAAKGVEAVGKAAKDAAKSNVGLIVGGAIATGVGLAIYIKR